MYAEAPDARFIVVRISNVYGPGAPVAAVVELIGDLAAGDEGEFGWIADIDVPLWIMESERRTVLEIISADAHRLVAAGNRI